MAHTDHPVTDYPAVVGSEGQLIDVREPDEVANGTLPGAVNIPLSQFVERVGELDKARAVVVLCRTGGRSTKAAEFLTQSGFTNVVNLAGGFKAYSEAS